MLKKIEDFKIYLNSLQFLFLHCCTYCTVLSRTVKVGSHLPGDQWPVTRLHWRPNWKSPLKTFTHVPVHRTQNQEGNNQKRGFLDMFQCQHTFTCAKINCVTLHIRDRGSTVVKVLCYKSEGRWFLSQLVSVDFSLTQNPSDRTMALGSIQPLTEMSTRSIS